MRENSSISYIDSDNERLNPEQKSEIIKLSLIKEYPWIQHESDHEIIFDFFEISYLSCNDQIKLIHLIKEALKAEKKIKLINHQSGILPEFLYWI